MAAPSRTGGPAAGRTGLRKRSPQTVTSRFAISRPPSGVASNRLGVNGCGSISVHPRPEPIRLFSCMGEQLVFVDTGQAPIAHDRRTGHQHVPDRSGRRSRRSTGRRGWRRAGRWAAWLEHRQVGGCARFQGAELGFVERPPGERGSRGRARQGPVGGRAPAPPRDGAGRRPGPPRTCPRRCRPFPAQPASPSQPSGVRPTAVVHVRPRVVHHRRTCLGDQLAPRRAAEWTACASSAPPASAPASARRATTRGRTGPPHRPGRPRPPPRGCGCRVPSRAPARHRRPASRSERVNEACAPTMPRDSGYQLFRDARAGSAGSPPARRGHAPDRRDRSPRRQARERSPSWPSVSARMWSDPSMAFGEAWWSNEGRGPRQQRLAAGDERRGADGGLVEGTVEAPPDALQDLEEGGGRLEPVRHAAGEGGVDVGVGADVAGHDQAAAAVERGGIRRQLSVGSRRCGRARRAGSLVSTRGGSRRVTTCAAAEQQAHDPTSAGWRSARRAPRARRGTRRPCGGAVAHRQAAGDGRRRRRRAPRPPPPRSAPAPSRRLPWHRTARPAAGSSTMMHSTAGMPGRRDDAERLELADQRDAVLHLERLAEGVAEAHVDAALDLALDRQRVDRPAHVLRRDDPLEPRPPSSRITTCVAQP